MPDLPGRGEHPAREEGPAQKALDSIDDVEDRGASGDDVDKPDAMALLALSRKRQAEPCNSLSPSPKRAKGISHPSSPLGSPQAETDNVEGQLGSSATGDPLAPLGNRTVSLVSRCIPLQEPILSMFLT
jgi:hypothetical protein